MRLSIICCFLFSCFLSFSQDSIPDLKERKIQISFIGGGYYKFFLGKRYVEPTPYSIGDEFSNHQYERFTRKPTEGYQAGLMLAFKLFRNFSLRSGLIFCNRRSIYENDMDTVIKYGYFPYAYRNIRDVHNALKYDYSYNNIELPVLFNLEIKRFSFSAGIRLAILSFYKEKITYVVNQFPQTPQYITSEKTIKYVSTPLMLYPAIQLSYVCPIRRLNVSPFMEIDLGSQKSLYCQGGLLLSLKKTSPKTRTNL
jgi:hypothetical protein